ncbi:hypothetical protein Trydic_g19549 [Trypoxylus dichotomus]
MQSVSPVFHVLYFPGYYFTFEERSVLNVAFFVLLTGIISTLVLIFFMDNFRQLGDYKWVVVGIHFAVMALIFIAGGSLLRYNTIMYVVGLGILLLFFVFMLLFLCRSEIPYLEKRRINDDESRLRHILVLTFFNTKFVACIVYILENLISIEVTGWSTSGYFALAFTQLDPLFFLMVLFKIDDIFRKSFMEFFKMCAWRQPGKRLVSTADRRKGSFLPIIGWKPAVGNAVRDSSQTSWQHSCGVEIRNIEGSNEELIRNSDGISDVLFLKNASSLDVMAVLDGSENDKISLECKGTQRMKLDQFNHKMNSNTDLVFKISSYKCTIEDWRKVVFSDESKLEAMTGRAQFVRRRSSELFGEANVLKMANHPPYNAHFEKSRGGEKRSKVRNNRTGSRLFHGVSQTPRANCILFAVRGVATLLPGKTPPWGGRVDSALISRVRTVREISARRYKLGPLSEPGMVPAIVISRSSLFPALRRGAARNAKSASKASLRVVGIIPYKRMKKKCPPHETDVYL